MTKRLIGAGLACVLSLGLLASTTVHGQDLTTLLSKFLNDLYAGTINVGGAGDALIVRDAANTLALRNGTNAQTFRVYNTFTDAVNFERAVFSWSGNTIIIGADAGGTGTLRSVAYRGQTLVFQTGASNTSRWDIDANGMFIAATDNTYDIGASGANRPRNYFGAGVVQTARFTSNTSAPTLSTCGTGTIDSNSTDAGGKVTATGATACTVTFTAAYPTAAWCVISDDTTIGNGKITAQSASAFTVSALTSGDAFQYVCVGK